MSKALSLILLVAFMVVSYGYMTRTKQVADLHAAMYLQIRDAQPATCEIKQHETVHSFQCVAKRGKYAALL